MDKEKQIALVNKAVWESIADLPNNIFISTNDWLQVTTPGNPAPHMNGVYRCEKNNLTQAELDELVANVVAEYKSHSSNFRWKTSSSTRPPHLKDSLKKHGMKLKDLLYGFCVPTLILPISKAPLPVQQGI